jgi:hypothetical protein
VHAGVTGLVQRRPRDFYPPESAEALAKTLLWDAGELSAAVDGAVEAHTLKKHLLLYYLLDLSPPAEEDSVRRPTPLSVPLFAPGRSCPAAESFTADTPYSGCTYASTAGGGPRELGAGAVVPGGAAAAGTRGGGGARNAAAGLARARRRAARMPYAAVAGGPHHALQSRRGTTRPTRSSGTNVPPVPNERFPLDDVSQPAKAAPDRRLPQYTSSINRLATNGA